MLVVPACLAPWRVQKGQSAIVMFHVQIITVANRCQHVEAPVADSPWGLPPVGFLRVLRYLSFHVPLLWGDSPCRSDLLRPQMLARVNRRHDVVKIPSPVKCVARRSSSARVPSHVRTAYREDSSVNRLILRDGLQISRCKTTRICYVDGKYVAHN